MARGSCPQREIMDTNSEGGSGKAVVPVRKRGPYRSHSLEEKRRVVHECLTSGDSVSIVARRHDVNANQLFGWRKQYERGQLGPVVVPSTPPPPLLAVRVEEPVAREPKSVTASSQSRQPSWIEIECTRPYCVRVHGAVDREALTAVLEVLSAR